MFSDIVPWLCWCFPIIGAVFTLPLAKVNRKVRDGTVILFSFLAWLMAIFMLPELFAATFLDKPLLWISLPNVKSVGIGMLLDPLSIILANIVAFLGFLIMVYSSKYMEEETGVTRYWFLMSLFMGSMLLLVLADNLILFFVGWKVVGLCSFALIGYYYSDEKKHWIGGPTPFPFQKPSRCGLKSLLVTTFGDVALLSGILMLYLYSGTFNLMELYRTANVWLAKIAFSPGMLILISMLMLGGPIAKSAQFPLHEWLPEAMAGPTPVSALIHAATMVKAGVYLVARMLPVFYYAYWQANHAEALTFFILTAIIGAFTAFLSGTQAMVSLELKKALAYSTMCQIGYMMLGLGVAGLSPNVLVSGFSAAIFHLVNNGIHKAALFLCAGAVIQASGTIYMSKMRLSRHTMGFTWLFMWIAAFSLLGIPPFTGYWSKNEVLLACWQSGQYILYAIASATVAIKCFYTVRFMGMTFHKKNDERTDTHHNEETGILMLLPYAILAALTIVMGFIGPTFVNFLQQIIHKYFTEILNLPVDSRTSAMHTSLASNPTISNTLVLIITLFMIVIGSVPAYMLYISNKSTLRTTIHKHHKIQRLHNFFWERWYINSFYDKVFVNGMVLTGSSLIAAVEEFIDNFFNNVIPKFFTSLSRVVRRGQTGILSINMIYVLIFIAGIICILYLLKVL
jgi:NADH-quinone oxidoreductase subunit L